MMFERIARFGSRAMPPESGGAPVNLPMWNGEPKECGGCWTLRKDKRVASCHLFTHPKYVVKRQEAGASNASINRELAIIKRAFALPVQAGELMTKPNLPMLEERNTRRGFFEPAQFAAVLEHLPTALRAVASFAYNTGWRVKSEVLPLEWRHVDWNAREVRLDPWDNEEQRGPVVPPHRGT